MRGESRDEAEYERELQRILASDLEDGSRRDLTFGNGLRMFAFVALATAICLIAYFGLVASH